VFSTRDAVETLFFSFPLSPGAFFPHPSPCETVGRWEAGLRDSRCPSTRAASFFLSFSSLPTFSFFSSFSLSGRQNEEREKKIDLRVPSFFFFFFPMTRLSFLASFHFLFFSIQGGGGCDQDAISRRRAFPFLSFFLFSLFPAALFVTLFPRLRNERRKEWAPFLFFLFRRTIFPPPSFSPFPLR